MFVVEMLTSCLGSEEVIEESRWFGSYARVELNSVESQSGVEKSLQWARKSCPVLINPPRGAASAVISLAANALAVTRALSAISKTAALIFFLADWFLETE